MDKNTMSNHGWIVIVALVLVAMIGISSVATNFISNGAKNQLDGLQGKFNGAFTDPPEKPTMLEGDGQTFHRFAPTTLSFRSSANLGDFKEVQVNGETVDPAHYTLTEGSTIVTLSIDYLKTLDVTEHEVTIVSENGAPSAKFAVIEPETNEYGFYYNQPYANVNFGGLVILHEDGTCDFVSFDSGAMQWVYTINGNELTLEYAEAGMQFTGTVEANMLHINEMDATFTLDGETIAVDENYVYCYIEELNGYDVRPFNFTKTSHDAIKTAVNDLPVVKIGNGAFWGSTSLTNVEIPASVTIIGDCAFCDCTALESIEIPRGVTTIGSQAFYNCKALESIIFEKGSQLVTIDHSAFAQCISLVNVEIPASVTFVGRNAFRFCTSLDNVIIPEGVTTIDPAAFSSCKSLINIKLHDSITSIGSHAFSFCTSLESVEIPASVTIIGYNAFSYCSALTSITFEGTVEQWNAITFTEYNGVSNWNKTVPATEVVCSDGTVSLS